MCFSPRMFSNFQARQTLPLIKLTSEKLIALKGQCTCKVKKSTALR